MKKREDGVTYIATISGGKDSTVMCDMLLKNNYPVDYIIFTDTLAEHKEMYEYIDKVNDYFKSRYKKEITILKPNKTPEDIMFAKVIDRKGVKRVGQIKGIPNPIAGFCEWRSEAKLKPIERWKKKLGIKNVKTYIGFTLDEGDRANRDDDCTNLYPLIDNFKMSEEQCKQYLIVQEMENPLYKHFSRTGCAWCPASSMRDKYQIWKHYPDVWDFMKKTEERLVKLEESGETIISIGWHRQKSESISFLEKQFISMNKQGSLFDFSDEPLKDCFCKI